MKKRGQWGGVREASKKYSAQTEEIFQRILFDIVKQEVIIKFV